MRHVIFLFIMLISFCDLCSQKIVPIPDRNYWDVSYSYQLHFSPTGKYQSEISLLEEDSFEVEYNKVLRERLMSIKKENTTKGKDFNYPDLNSKLKKLKELYLLSNNVSLDYYHGDNEDFRRFLTSIFNFHYYNDFSTKMWFYLSALEDYDKIPYKSNYRAIGFPMKELTHCIMQNLNGSNVDQLDLRAIDSTAKTIFNRAKRTPQEQVDFYESLGDFWSVMEKEPINTLQYYRIAQSTSATYRLKSYSAYIQWERLNDKGFWSTYPNSTRGNSFSNVAVIAMNNIDSHTTEEFFTHHLVLKLVFFVEKKNIDSVNIYYRMIIDRMNTKNSKWFSSDLYHIFLLFEVNPKKQKLSLYNFSEDLIDLVDIRELVRTRGVQATFQRCFEYFYSIKSFENAHLVNSYIDNLSFDKQENGHSFMYNVNSALLYYIQNTDSSKIIFDYIKGKISHASESEQLFFYYTLAKIAEIEGDLKAYIENKRKIEEINGDNSQAYGQYKWQITMSDNRDYDIKLLDSISLIKLLKKNADALAIKNDSLANAKTLYAQTQENEKKLLISLRLADSTKNAQILDVQTKANKELQGYINGLIAIFVIVVILSVLLFFSYRSRSKQKEATKALEIMQAFSEKEAEKSKLEIETLRTIFFSHSFWSAFGQIPIKLRIAKLNNDEQKSEIALGISEGLGRVFYEAVRTDNTTSNLLDEMMLCKKYIETMNLAYSKDVQFKLTGSSDLMKLIPFPRLILIHFFVNAFEHGKVGNFQDGCIHVELKPSAVENEYEFVIHDNGIGIEKKIESVSRGGFRAIEIGLSNFNLTQSKTQCFFNAATDVYSRFTEGYALRGVMAVIKMTVNEKKY